MPKHRVRFGSPALTTATVVILLRSTGQTASATDATELAGAQALPEVVVVGATPLPNSDLPLEEIPANVQRVSAGQLQRLQTPNLADALSQLGGSININDTQGNPFQPDVDFRGFTASPVLGTPQGVSVFVDGVRVNEAFGDAVNWDLVPAAAIAGIDVKPGSDPVFGLNTLGGALSVTTKRGFDFPDTSVEVQGGSFGRREGQVETGGHGERWDYFLAGNLFDETGWGDHNPSRVRQGFAKAGYRDDNTDITLSATYADNRIEGNQTLPRSFLSDPWQSYTWPDIQTDRMAFVSFIGTHRLGEHWSLAATAYYRKVSTASINSNVNNDFDPTLPIGPGNEPTQNALVGIDQYRPGGTLQVVGRAPVAGHRNTIIAGVSYDRGTTNFQQLDQDAAASRDTSSSAPTALATLLRATNRYSGVYVTDTLGLTGQLYLNVAGRYNDASVSLQDRLGTALNGFHTFHRFDPAVGATFNPRPGLTLYASFDEGMRVPTPVELACADRNAPCSLPNAFSSDPPLKEVVARTVEVGARGKAGGLLSYTLALFQTRLSNDIQFISSGGGAVNAGFFQNVGQTRRQGVELGIDSTRGPISLSLHYTYLQATFQTPLVLNSPNNSTAGPVSCPTCTEIQVVSGDRLPGVPQHVVKLRAEYTHATYGFGVNVIGQSAQFARGDENNRDINGSIPGFVLVTLDAHRDLSRRWRVSARLDNVFDRRYYTFGALGQNVFTAPGNTLDPTGATWRSEQFRTVGLPRGGWVTVQFRPQA